MSDLRIFSYLPNPRIWKATIAARLCGVDVEVRGTSPKEISTWLWDFDARPLISAESANGSEATAGKVGFNGTLHKTRAFVDAHPFATVPAAFSPDGQIGIFESNSIMRAVARIGESRFPLYGHGPYEAARIDSFLDVSLVFARDSQIYLLALASGAMTSEIHARAHDSFAVYAGGIDRALEPDRAFLTGDNLTLADICFVAELSLFHNEKARVRDLEAIGAAPILHGWESSYPLAFAHFETLRKHPAFAPDVELYLKKLETPRPGLSW
jgi:elongation factor 1-gamma